MSEHIPPSIARKDIGIRKYEAGKSRRLAQPKIAGVIMVTTVVLLRKAELTPESPKILQNDRIMPDLRPKRLFDNVYNAFVRSKPEATTNNAATVKVAGFEKPESACSVLTTLNTIRVSIAPNIKNAGDPTSLISPIINRHKTTAVKMGCHMKYSVR